MSSSEAGSRSAGAWTAAALVLVASLVGAVSIAEWPLWGVSQEEIEEPHLVEPAENGTKLWPYTSRDRDHSTRTLGINVVVHGDPEYVRMAMLYRSELEWRETPPDEQDRDPEQDRERGRDVARFGEANGAIRYTYVETEDDEFWLIDDYQIHSGTYLGQRMHVRAYEDPNGEWTAMQAHHEHWDWFRLRHTVTGISDAQREVERDFMGAPFVESVSREPYEHATADGDGWATNIRLSLAILLPVGLLAVGRFQRANRRLARLFERHSREFALGVVLFALYLGIRLLGIELEVRLTEVPPRFIAAPLYLLLAGGTPAVAYFLGRGANPAWSFTHAVGGLGTAFVIDFVLMGVSVVPLRFVLHRTAVLLAVGLIAVGSTVADEENRRWPLVVGVVGWIVALVLPLLGYV